ncbi:MAG: hypothetical protein WAX66_02830 [Patescibacteria group bacterium]
MKDQKKNTQITYAIATLAIILCVSLLLFRKENSNNSGNKQGGNNSQFNGGNGTSPEGNPQGKGPDLSNIDYASIAQKLNVTEDKVKEAFTVADGERLNLENVASTLGISAADLRTAMGIPEMGPPKAEEKETSDSSN